MTNSGAADALMAFVRGGTEVNLTDAGLELHYDAPGSVRVVSPASAPVVRPSKQDIAQGFARASSRGNLRQWASLILAVSNIELDALADDPDEVILNALWDAAGGEPVSEVALRRLQQS